MKKTKIVCTIGPASESKEVFAELVKSGLNVARLNFSHGDHAEHLVRIEAIKEVRKELNKPVAILLDTKGPEIRTGSFKEPIELIDGQTFTVNTPIKNGTSENKVAKIVAKTLKGQLPKEAFHVERDDGEDVLIKKRRGTADFYVEIISNTVEHVRIDPDSE